MPVHLSMKENNVSSVKVRLCKLLLVTERMLLTYCCQIATQTHKQNGAVCLAIISRFVSYTSIYNHVYNIADLC